MDYTKFASLWTSYKSEDLKDFFNSNFFKSYVAKIGVTDPYELRLKLSNDMENLDLIPLTALEDAYSEECELRELEKFAKLYKM